MEDFGLWLKDMRAQAGSLIVDIRQELLTIDTLVQMTAICLACVLSWTVSKKLAFYIYRWMKAGDRHRFFRLSMSYFELLFFIILAVLLWFSVAVLSGLGYSVTLLQILANLSTAWALIRLTSGMIGSRFWARTIAIVLWIAAALSILGILGPVRDAMDDAAFTVGKVRLSVLLLIKSVIIFALFFWAIGVTSRILERLFNRSDGLTSSQKVLFFKLSNIFLYALAIFVGLNLVGLDLTALAVFGGALGLGIGFGLQKIFSNLVSGIILLMDKSVKPGDVIAVGDSYGWVNKLGARYVSVLTRDGKEHLIPNENLISEQVENWSYSDTNIRIHVPIGVSYGADIHKVRDLIIEAAQASQRVLRTHPIVCLLKDFGDSSVNFELRAWIGDPQAGVSNIKSEILFNVWDIFKANGIEIPFPQRDLHVKIDDELKNLIAGLRKN